MGHQVIRQPDGKLAVYSSITDAWILVDASPDELLDYYAEKAAEDARRNTRRVLDAVLADKPHEVYYQFAMTFGEANQRTREGFLWRDGQWEENPDREEDFEELDELDSSGVLDEYQNEPGA